MRRVAALALPDSQGGSIGPGIIDPRDENLYYWTGLTYSRWISKVKLADFSWDGFLSRGATNASFAIAPLMDPEGWFAYFSDFIPYSPETCSVHKLDLGSFKESGELSFPSGILSGHSAAIDPTGTFGYFITGRDSSNYRNIDKVQLGQKGYIKATRLHMPSNGVVQRLFFYSHKAAGQVRLAIYDDSVGTRRLRWQSPPVVNNAEDGWLAVDIVGDPPKLERGDYWLAWQIDTSASVPSLTRGHAGDGFFVVQAYGGFPDTIAASATTYTPEEWSAYLTYEATSAAVSWQKY